MFSFCSVLSRVSELVEKRLFIRELIFWEVQGATPQHDEHEQGLADSISMYRISPVVLRLDPEVLGPSSSLNKDFRRRRSSAF